MKLTKTVALLTGLTIGMAITASASTVVLSNDFTSGTTTGWLIKDATGTSGGGTLAVQDDSGAGKINSGNAMLLTTSSKTRFATIDFPQPIMLGANDSITLKMDYRYVYGVSNTANSMAFRFVDSSTGTNGDFMGVGINAGATTANSSWFQRNGAVEGAKWANDFVHDLTAESVTFTITRGADDKATYVISWAGGSTFTKTGAVATDPANDFIIDRLQIGFAAITSGGFLMDNVVVTMTDSDTSYLLTVNSGTPASGSHTNGAQVTITANNIPGKTFTQWIGDTQYVASVTSSPTVVTMSTNPVSLTATYVDAYYHLNVINGNGDGDYTNFTRVAIAADAPNPGTTFDRWIGTGTQSVDNVTAPNTTITMPTKNISLTATYTSNSVGSYTTNGTPYAWLTEYGFANPEADDLLDQDSDGLLTWQEYIAGTVPTNAASCLRATENPLNTISWSAVSGRVYSVYGSTNLVSGFTSLATNILPPQSSYTNLAPSASSNFYQIKVQMQ